MQVLGPVLPLVQERDCLVQAGLYLGPLTPLPTPLRPLSQDLPFVLLHRHLSLDSSLEATGYFIYRNEEIVEKMMMNN